MSIIDNNNNEPLILNEFNVNVNDTNSINVVNNNNESDCGQCCMYINILDCIGCCCDLIFCWCKH